MRSLTSACADFLLPLFGLFHVLANPSLDDPADQRIGNALFQRKSQVALFIRIGRHIGAKFCIRSHRWIEADVMLEGGEMYEVAAKGERGYLVADGFRGIGRSFPDRRPDLFQYRSDVRRKGRDVAVDGSSVDPVAPAAGTAAS
jgi:hypothetical protein